QLNWLTSAITKSNAKCQILGQQVLMTKMCLPTEIFSQSDRTKIPQLLKELVAIKKAVLANKALTPAQLARVNTL
ncbi:alkaline phosphatase, partial [Pseudoalteromonas issachenkonii]